MILLKNNSYYEDSERLFSTGDSELDDILEEVYYSGLEDGYDYAQKEFSKLSGTKNKIKAIPRHLKRSINQEKAGFKIATLENRLSPEEVKAVAITYRGAKVPGSKTAKRMEKMIKNEKVTKETIDREAKAWDRIHKQSQGAERSFLGYLSPDEAWASNSAMHRISHPEHPMYKNEEALRTIVRDFEDVKKRVYKKK